MRKWFILLGAIIVAAIIDQASKGWIVDNLEPYQSVQPIPTLAPFFQLTRSSNTGAAFGILPAAGNLFLLLAFLIIGIMLWHFRSAAPGARFLPLATGIVIGGAFGNVIDRLQYGHVIDFIHYQIPGLVSNVSNLADHAIVGGVLLIIGESFLRERKLKAEGAAESESADSGTDRSRE
ncbi:MAG: signal peptidase II [Chloroflexota bacterium]|nr:signal peptidase II [Chloroflexota bacterium]MDE2951832.1 signal peptidase II [Chloroflexota bacterium]